MIVLWNKFLYETILYNCCIESCSHSSQASYMSNIPLSCIQPCRFLVFFSPSELGTLITFLCQWPFENGSSFCFGQRIGQMDLLHLPMQWQMPKQINHSQNCLTAISLGCGCGQKAHVQFMFSIGSVLHRDLSNFLVTFVIFNSKLHLTGNFTIISTL